MFKEWQLLRKSLSPTFAQGRLNKMFAPMEDFAEAAIERAKALIDASADGEIDVDLLYQG